MSLNPGYLRPHFLDEETEAQRSLYNFPAEPIVLYSLSVKNSGDSERQEVRHLPRNQAPSWEAEWVWWVHACHLPPGRLGQ